MLLSLAAIAWLVLHIGLAGTALRGWLVARLGEKGFLGSYSLISIVSIAALSAAYASTPAAPMWAVPVWLGWILVAVMLPAFILFVASVASPNPTAVGAETRPDSESRGIFRITRHPMLWAFTIWGVVHIITNGTWTAFVFFGAFVVTALAGMPSIDSKLAARSPERWARLARATSIVPGAAILAGRNRLDLREIGWVVPLIGVVVWALVLGVHPYVIGYPALPQ